MKRSCWRKVGWQVAFANVLAFMTGGVIGLLFADFLLLALLAAAFAASRIWPNKIWFRRLDSR